jgi:hypothetical protein
MADRLTAAEVRDALIGAGWVDNPSPWRGLHHLGKDWECSTTLPESCAMLRIDGPDMIYRGPLPSTLSDLWALLRCLGAPVLEYGVAHRIERREQEAVAQTWNMATCVNELLEGFEAAIDLADDGEVYASETIGRWRAICDRANHYVNQWKLKTERRKEDHPELIPCKFPDCGCLNDEEECSSYIHWEIATLDWHFKGSTKDTWRLLMGRRRSDWEAPRG